MTARITPADLATRFDEATLKDLASDSGVPAVDITTDTNLLAACEDATGEFESAVMVSSIYTTDDLDDLTGSSLALAKRIMCELAMVFLMARRPEKYESQSLKDLTERVEAFLDRLRKGERVFNIAAKVAAGLPTIDGPSTVDFQELNLITARTRNFYPHYSRRLPLGR